MGARRRSSPREDDGRELKKRWEESGRWREAGWSSTTPAELELFGRDPREIDDFNFCSINTFDAQGEPVTITLRGEDARKASRAMDEHLANKRNKVENWNKKIDG